LTGGPLVFCGEKLHYSTEDNQVQWQVQWSSALGEDETKRGIFARLPTKNECAKLPVTSK
jgi:hypothetical protein